MINNFSSADKKPRTAKQIIAPYKNRKAHTIPQRVIDMYVEQLTREGTVVNMRGGTWQRPKSKRIK